MSKKFKNAQPAPPPVVAEDLPTDRHAVSLKAPDIALPPPLPPPVPAPVVAAVAPAPPPPAPPAPKPKAPGKLVVVKDAYVVLNGCSTKLSAGQVIDPLGYGSPVVESMRAQGVSLEPAE